jgi:molybdopterin converting factor small subunit
MSVTVRIPTTLRPLTAGAATVATEGATVSEVLNDLEARHPGMRARILDESGALHRYVNVFVDDEDVRFLDGPGTEVPVGSTVAIVPAVAGGAATA